MNYIKVDPGTKFNKLTFIEETGRNKQGRIKWLCECECGKRVVVVKYKVTSGHTKSCGCLVKKSIIPLIERVRQFKKNWREANKDYSRLKLYGITQEEVQLLVEQQNNSCAICLTQFTKTPHVDHDHATGKVRGLLCTICNFGLGLVKDDTNLLEILSSYIIIPRTKQLQLSFIEKVLLPSEKAKAHNLKYGYGITYAFFNYLLTLQNNACAACQKHFTANNKPCVDHDHTSGIVRGLLCHSCNLALGKFKDQQQRILNAIKYLKLHLSS